MIEKIVSGGQTGVDLAALTAAKEAGIPYGGWCPKGRINETGIIPIEFNALQEVSGDFKNEQDNYATRTKYNIRDSDATLILVPTIPMPAAIQDGTILSIQEVTKQKKPYLIIDLSESQKMNTEAIARWILNHRIEILNIAGPRESSCPGIYQSSLNLLNETLHYFLLQKTWIPKTKFVR